MTATQQSLIFWGYFVLLVGIIIYLDQKYDMLRDSSIQQKKPYSYARVQLAWWTSIVLASFFCIMTAKHAIPTFDESTLILLGISAATTGAARIIDQSDQQKPDALLAQNQPSQDFFLDILSDGTGPNLHRFQTVLFNLAFGIWFIAGVISALPGCNAGDCISKIMPHIEPNNLVLLGLSAGTYAALKTTENKPTPASMPDTVTDESGKSSPSPAQG